MGSVLRLRNANHLVMFSFEFKNEQRSLYRVGRSWRQSLLCSSKEKLGLITGNRGRLITRV